MYYSIYSTGKFNNGIYQLKCLQPHNNDLLIMKVSINDYTKFPNNTALTIFK